MEKDNSFLSAIIQNSSKWHWLFILCAFSPDLPKCWRRLSVVFWWGPVYSSFGRYEAWCVFGCKQWMHHVEWIFASLRARWTIITQTRFCSERISITTLACPHCVWLCHHAVSCPPVRLQNTDDWVVIICMLVECRRDFVCFHKGITVRSGTALFLKFVIQGSRGVDWDYGASIQHFCQCWWYDLWFSFLFFKHFFWRASVFLFVFLEWSHQFLKAPLCCSLRPIIPDLNFRLTFELNNEKLPETHKTAQKLVVMFLIVNRK